MSKIEANKFKLLLDGFYFEKMINRVVNVIGLRIEEKQQKFQVYIDQAIPKKLFGDDQRLAQVITNLLGNAVKFTPDHGSITLDARLLKEENNICTLQISIIDTGIGIEAKQQEHLFDSFEQVEAVSLRKFGGTGLGLAISKAIVEMMGGEIWVESEVKKGTTFAFTVQVNRGTEENHVLPGQQQTMEIPADIPHDFAGHCILLAEDVEINREIILSLLEPTHLKIDCAENGAEAVRMFCQAPHKYDMIFMDVQMPEMDGLEATRCIRIFEAELVSHSPQLLERSTGVPIIAMTAKVFKEDVEKCLEAGMNDHIGKPLDFIAVQKSLCNYLLKA